MRCDTDLPLKRCKDLRGSFSPDKAEDAGGLTPTKDDNAVWRKTGRKNCIGFMEVQYEIHGRDKKQNKYPPAQPGVFHMRALPLFTSYA